MDARQLQMFIAVAEELHFGRAAERMHIAQPAMTRAIKQLESDLGSRLFDRSTRAVRLTSAGEALLAPAYQILEDFRRARDVVNAVERGDSGRVRVAFTGASADVVVGRLAAAVRRTHPGIQLQLASAQFGTRVLEQIIDEDLEIGLGRWQYVPSAISSRVVSRERLVLAVPSSHPVAALDEVSMRELEHELFVTLPPGGSVLVPHLKSLANRAGFVPRVIQVAPDSWTLMALVAAGIGISLTLSSVVENAGRAEVEFVDVIEATDDIELRMAWKSSSLSPALLRVLAIAEDLFSTPT